jgi:hypothetical protein
MKEKCSSAVPLVAFLMLVLVPGGAYVGGYFLRSTVLTGHVIPGGQTTLTESKTRLFATKWEAAIYQPAARIETLVIGKYVDAIPPIVAPEGIEVDFRGSW